MKIKSITTHARWLTCLIALAVIFATFLAGMGPSASADTDVFENIELKVGDTLGFVYYTNQTYSDKTTMRFEINGRQSISPAYPNDGKCVFIFNDIYPHELGKDIKATIVVNGKDTVTTSGLSVKKYLLEILFDNSQPKKMHKFASNVLQYGEATRLYRNANVDVSQIDNKEILDFDETIYTNYDPDPIDTVWPGTAPGLGTSAATVRMASIGIAYYNTNKYVITFKSPANSVVDMSKVTVDVQIGANTTTYTSSSFQKNANGDWELQTQPINGHAITNTVQFTLKIDGSIKQQATYSPFDYVYQLQDTNGDALALRYAKSLCQYGEAAKEVYGGAALRVVAVDCKTAPNNVTVTNKNAVTPTGGSILVHYSDGSSATLTSGFTWSNTDYETGNQVKITDDTYQATFKVRGTYTDPVSGKTFSFASRVTLSNPMTSISRYNDANTYVPSSHQNSHTPVGASVNCKWSNGYTSVRNASNGVTFSAVDTSGLATTEYAQLKSTATYKDPKSGVTKTTSIYVMYENPIQTISIANSSYTMKDGKTAVTPAHTTFNVTYKNTKSTTGLSTNQTAFTWSTAAYDGTDTSATLSVQGNYAIAKSSSYTVYKNGSATTKSYDARTVSSYCTVAISNPEKSISIVTVPTVKGGFVTSTAAPVSGSSNGNLTGGTTQVTMANGKTKTANGVTYSCSAGITDATYSKSVTVTAKYNGMTASNKNITLYNDVASFTQSIIPQVPSESTTNTQIVIAHVAGSFTATYTNGYSTTVAPTHITVNGTARDTSCYVQSITSAAATSADRSTAATSSTSTSYSALGASFIHPNTGTTKTCSLYVRVYTYVTGIVGGQSAGNVTMTSATDVPIPNAKNLQITFSNGKTGTGMCTFSRPAVVTTNSEYEDKSVTAYYTDANGNTVSVTGVACRVINPAVSAVTYTDPDPKTVSGTGSYSPSSGGYITVTFVNGKTALKACTSYSGSGAISDASLYKRVNVSGKWQGSYSSATATDMYFVLWNPVNASAYSTTVSTGSSSNKIKLTSSSVACTATIKVSLANGKVYGTSYTSTYNYKNTSTTSTSGSASVSFTITSPNASTTRKVSGSNTTISLGTKTVTGTGTIYWTNPLSSIAAKTAGTCTAKYYTTTSFSITQDSVSNEKVTATFSNGAKKDYDPTIASQTVNNVTDASYYKTTNVTASLTVDGVKKTCSIGITVYNDVSSYSVSNQSFAFSSSQVSYSVTGTVYFVNSYWVSAAPTSASFADQTPGTYSYSSGKFTATYSGSDYAYWQETPTFNYKHSSSGKTVTSKPTFSFYNYFYVILYRDSSLENMHYYTEGKSEGSYLYVYFNSGNNSTYTTSGDYYPMIHFNNGASKKYTGKLYTDSSGKTALTYNKGTTYLGGNTFKATLNSSDSAGSLQKVFIYYSLNGQSEYDYYYVIPRTTSTQYFETEELKLRHSNDWTHHVQPTCWQVYVRHYATGANGVSTQVSYGYNFLPANNNQKWYYYWDTGKTDNWFTNVNTFDTGDFSTYVYKDGDTGQRAGMSGWCYTWLDYSGAKNGSYISYNMPSSITLDGKSCTPRDTSSVYKDTYTWVTHCRFMGYT